MKYTIEESAKYLSVSPGFLYRLINIGKLKCVSGLICKEDLVKCNNYLKEKYAINIL